MMKSQESSHSPKIRRTEAPGRAWLSGGPVAAYCLAFPRHGGEVADEGALLAHEEREPGGHVPFHAGYGRVHCGLQPSEGTS
jgi:hypothetical protein